MSNIIRISRDNIRTIRLIQAKREMALLESQVFEMDDWFNQTLMYFQGLDEKLMSKCGFQRTSHCLILILKINITKELVEKVLNGNMVIPVRM